MLSVPSGIFNKRTFQKFFSFQVIAQTALLGAALSCAASADTLNPGDQFTVNFTLPASDSDVFIMTTNPITEIGEPVVTASLYNGATLLGKYTSAPQMLGRLDMVFESSTSPYTTESPTVIDFTSVNAGMNAGRLVMTVTGGSLDYLIGDGFYGRGASSSDPDSIMVNNHATITGSSVGSATPEPASFGLAVLGAGLVLFVRRKFVKA